MKLTDPFIRRPVLALVVNLVIIIAGLQAIKSLNVRQYPRNENSVVTITTVYVGASADLVRGFVTVPLERAIAAADGIDYLKSQSSLGLSTISARLKLNYDPIKRFPRSAPRWIRRAVTFRWRPRCPRSTWSRPTASLPRPI
ncbi:efflux RND transporter permease subunit [Desulfosarcina cetonica]|uniref:efflux RND transporter permease subunit n=1 Tax=Desulfosarcina cetonica TaxID=90730 RepID=UPI000A6E75EA|nr:efflux RND transporter permease subunit [Desulfosarcina cetonica]